MIPASPGIALPDLLLPYQQKLVSLSATSRVVFCEKSRRIGMTWGIASDAVLTSAANKSARGMDTFYIGYNLDMAREFIDTCGMWAKNFSQACSEREEFIFKDDDEREITVFRIKFDSGFEICALSSRPRSLRGRQGYIIIDEAAFHDDLKELMKAALAMLIWGGKVLVISTHDGVENPFNEYIQDIRAGRLKYAVLKVDLDDALHDGLYKRICLTTGQEWSEQSEKKWRQEIVDFYKDAADEELFCTPRRSGGTFLSSVLVESRMVEAPVLRYRADDKFVYLPEEQRIRIVLEWCDNNLKALLGKLDPKFMTFFGEDFGRSGDLTVLWPLQLLQNLVRHTPFVVELANVPFQQQQQIVFYIIDRLPRFGCGAFDARGNGSQLAETTMQKYGAERIHRVMISREWYVDAMPKYKAGLEDAKMSLPKDADILNDHRAAIMDKGVAQIPDKRVTGADGSKRHGDSLIAAVMAYWASLQPVIEFGYEGISRLQPGGDPRDHDEDDRDREDVVSKRQFGTQQGAW